MNPFRYGRFAFQLAGHKLLRFVAPLLLVVLAVSGLAWDNGALRVLFGLQVGFYVVGAASGRVPLLQRHRVVRIGHLFTLVQWAMLLAWGKDRLDQQQTTWEPSQRRNIASGDYVSGHQS